MEVIEIAELISAFATFFTVCLAVIELVSRRKLKNAEEAIEAYANYLIAEQQIRYLVNSALALKEKSGMIKYKDCQSYATAHMPDSSLISLIESVEKESLTTFDSSKDTGRDKSMVILEAAGAATNVVTAASTFYQIILDYDDYQGETIDAAYELIKASSERLIPLNLKAEEILRKNLKDIHKSSNTYIISLICASLFFLGVCVVLGLF